MQNDVKVFIPEMLADIFPGLEIQGKPTPTSCVYRINVDVLNGEDLIKLVTIYLECAIDMFLCRQGKGITIRITMHPPGYEGRKRALRILPV